MAKNELHMIGNAHIDPVWLWQWQDGFQEVKATFKSALDRMNEYDDFVFVSSSAAFYEWVEQSDPAMFDEIKARVSEGRWEVVGGWWIQPDCNIPGGESFVRQGLYGQRYFREKLGVMAKTGYNVDSFGHNGMLPQILRKSGMDQYVFMRPGPHEKGLPGHVFWWESDDGSRVLTARILFEYCTWGKELDAHVKRCAEQLRAPVNQLMCFYGVGNHGGGPTKENVDSIHRLQQEMDSVQLVMSTPNRYFERLHKLAPESFPVVHDDLQHHASGCYAAHSGMKRWNRKAESLLLTAEKWSLLADWVVGQPYPDDYSHAWKGVLFNQFHDIMAGTSLEVAYDDARDLYGEAMSIASRGLNLAVQSFSWHIDIPWESDMKPIVVFNPHAWESHVNVEVELGRTPDQAVLVDDENRAVPLQWVQSLATANGRHRLSFLAQLPSLGYRVYRLRPGANNPSLTVKSDGWSASDTKMTSPFYEMEFNPDTGHITRLFDKQSGVDVFDKRGAIPVVIEDKSDTWSHGILSYQNEIGQFQAKRVRLLESGPVKASIRVTSEYGLSTLIQDFTMYRELRRIDVHVTVDWRERHKMLKLRFPVNLTHRDLTYEIPYGHIKRPINGEEESGQSWVDVTGLTGETGQSYGLSLVNDGKYSFSMHDKELHLTVLRSPIYAHHDPLVPDEDREYSFMDQGIQRFTYTLLPHQGSFVQGRTVQTAAEVNQRPIAVVETYHAGRLPQMDSFLTVDKENVLVSVVKRSEDDDAMVIRCHETSGATTAATVHLEHWNREFTATFAPSELKTFRISRDGDSVQETNLLELE